MFKINGNKPLNTNKFKKTLFKKRIEYFKN